MFKRGHWPNSDRIYSEDGQFFVSVGKDWLVYHEGERKMTITVDMGAKSFAVYLDTIGRWDDDLEHSVDTEEKNRIASNIKHALESQGQTVVLL
jgi:hypothetical protein